MNTIIEISYTQLLLGLALILIPIYFLSYYKTGLVKSTIVATVRMVVQLFLIGFYLEYLFKWNNLWVNIAWIIVMIFVASYTVIKRSNLSLKVVMIPISVAFIISLGIIDTYLFNTVLQLDNMFEARYFIPISGMILGNMLSANVIALNSYTGALYRERTMYMYMLANGATRGEATAPFIREAIIKSFNPTIASMAVMGLIALPGTMTGQILGGSSPNVAIKYQILIMITIFASSLISVLFTLWAVNRTLFDKFGVMRNRKS